MFVVVTRDLTARSVPEDDLLTPWLDEALREARARWDALARPDKADRVVKVFAVDEEDYRIASDPDNGVILEDYGRVLKTYALGYIEEAD